MTAADISWARRHSPPSGGAGADMPRVPGAVVSEAVPRSAAGGTLDPLFDRPIGATDARSPTLRRHTEVFGGPRDLRWADEVTDRASGFGHGKYARVLVSVSEMWGKVGQVKQSLQLLSEMVAKHGRKLIDRTHYTLLVSVCVHVSL